MEYEEPVSEMRRARDAFALRAGILGQQCGSI